MDRSLAIGLASFVLTASLLVIPAMASQHGEQNWREPTTRGQMEIRVAERFAAADTDSSGAISREEAEAHHAVRMAARRTRRFARIDVDDNGEISIAERDAAHARWMTRRGAHRGAMIAENRNMRGRLTDAEIAQLPEGAVRRPETESRSVRRVGSAERHNQAWAAADADGNGALNAEEFEAFHAARHRRMRERAANGTARGRRAMRHASRFDRMDADNNGLLTLAEVSARSLAMFERADADDDGTVTRDERRAARRARRAEHRRRR